MNWVTMKSLLRILKILFSKYFRILWKNSVSLMKYIMDVRLVRLRLSSASRKMMSIILIEGYSGSLRIGSRVIKTENVILINQLPKLTQTLTKSWRFQMHSASIRFLILFLLLSLIGCSPVSEFNQSAYDNAVSVKTGALTLISKANEPYIDHQSEIDLLKLNVENAYQFSKTIPNNVETISQWEIIRDPQRSSLFGLLERWKSKTRLSDIFISQVKVLIASDFNTIIDLENNKRKP